MYFRGSSNDPVLVEGILGYRWVWDGKNIIRIYREPSVFYGKNNFRKRYQSRETVIFAPEAAVVR